MNDGNRTGVGLKDSVKVSFLWWFLVDPLVTDVLEVSDSFHLLRSTQKYRLAYSPDSLSPIRTD